MTPRAGDWMQTFLGRQFWPLDARAEEVHVIDIAHSLSQQCRFAGHCNEFYSVAEHSVRVSLACDEEDALWGLLHDAAEAYLVDLPTPVKRSMAAYTEIETRLQVVLSERFGLSVAMPASVKRADAVLLATEARDLMAKPPADWFPMPPPQQEKIRPMTSKQAKDAFLTRFFLLSDGRCP